MSKKGRTMKELMAEEDKSFEELKKRAQRFKHKCPHCGKNIQVLVITEASVIVVEKANLIKSKRVKE